MRNSVGHTATVIANALMHCGTTCDDFLRCFVFFLLLLRFIVSLFFFGDFTLSLSCAVMVRFWSAEQLFCLAIHRLLLQDEPGMGWQSDQLGQVLRRR